MISLSNVNFTYANKTPGVKDISLDIKEGEIVLLCGGSGCGKTTLTKIINGIIPHYQEGDLSGEVNVCGLDIPNTPIYKTAEKIGSVFQNPRSQFFNTDTTSELAFACENLGIEPEVTLERIKKVAEELSLEDLLNKNIFRLSGGEKQKIACGSVATPEPDVYVLDEPTSNLDADGIKDLKKTVENWKSAGRTVVIAEHRIFWLRDIVDRVVMLDKGMIKEIMSGKDFVKKTTGELAAYGIRAGSLEELSYEADSKHCEREMIIKDFIYSYPRSGKTLDIPELRIPQGGVTALIGKNGAGKSTFCSVLCGLLKAGKSSIFYDNESYRHKQRLSLCYMVMQDVNHQLFTESVLDEIELSQKKEDREKAKDILKSFDLSELSARHPMSLSGGQKQRCAVASAVASGSKIIIYDEPTSGLDYVHMTEVAVNINKMRDAGKTQIIVTHDPELIMKCCDYVVHMEDGTVKEAYRLDKKNAAHMMEFFIR